MSNSFRTIILALLTCSIFLLRSESQQSDKISIAVLQLQAYGVSDFEASILTDRLRNELFLTQKFRVMEREQMDEILKEQGFQQSGCTSDECLVQIGKLINVKEMIGGSIGKIGKTFTVAIREIDIETGEIKKIATEDFQGDIDGLLTYIIPIIANQIAGKDHFEPISRLAPQNIREIQLESGQARDIDGNIYNIIRIGSQFWMAENLKVTHYRNGDPIPNLTDNSEWSILTTGAYCTYKNDIKKRKTFGMLYNWYAVIDGRNLAPEGWHVPSDIEWQSLIDFLGGAEVAGGNIKEYGFEHWLSPNLTIKKQSEFYALPGGYRDQYGNFYGLGELAFFWSSIEYDYEHAWSRNLYYSGLEIYRFDNQKNFGYSVRLIQD